MEREDIEKAARYAINKHYNCGMCCDRTDCEHCYGCNTAYDCQECGADGFKEGFLKGADWRIDSVWHKPQEKPKEGVFVLAEDEVKGYYSVYKLTGQNWEAMVVDYNILRWAYIEDLLPNMED